MTDEVANSPSDHPGDTTKLNMDWRENIATVAPEYVAEWDEFKNADTPQKFFDQLANHRKMLGQSIRIPGQDAGQQQMEEFWAKIQAKVPGLMRTPNPDDEAQVSDALKRLGLPDKIDEYQLADPAGIDPEAAGAYKAIAHKAKLTKKQFAEFTKAIAEREQQAKNQTTAAREEARATLRGEWGPAYEQRIEICARVAEKTGAPEVLINAIKAGNADAASMRWLYGLSQQFAGEGKNFLPEGHTAAPSTADLQGQISDIMNNPTHPYWVPSHPEHKRAVDRMIGLRKTLASVA